MVVSDGCLCGLPSGASHFKRDAGFRANYYFAKACYLKEVEGCKVFRNRVLMEFFGEEEEIDRCQVLKQATSHTFCT